MAKKKVRTNNSFEVSVPLAYSFCNDESEDLNLITFVEESDIPYKSDLFRKVYYKLVCGKSSHAEFRKFLSKTGILEEFRERLHEEIKKKHKIGNEPKWFSKLFTKELKKEVKNHDR